MIGPVKMKIELVIKGIFGRKERSMSKSVMKNLTMILLIAIIAFVWGGSIGCSKIEEETQEETDVVSIASLALSTTNAFVKSDNSDSATITVMALDENNGLVPNVAIQLSSTGGALGASSVVTSENGTVETTFSSGTINRSNQTVTITASATGADDYLLPLQIIGTELVITAQPSLQIGGDDTDTISVKVLDAGDNPVYNADVTFSLAASSTGSVTFSSSTATTDINGEATITATAVSQGDAVVSIGSMGVTQTHTYSVDSAGTGFYITAPSNEVSNLSIGSSRIITVNAPLQTTVRFATTVGTFQNALNVIDVTVSGGTASATFSSSNSGVATIEVYDADDLDTKDSITIAVSASVANANQIALQSSSNNVAPSVAGSENTVTLTAIVKTAADEPVGSAPVVFSISNSTGGGEYVSPVVVLTNAQGIANSTFTSGSLSSGGSGVKISASIVGSSPIIASQVPIVIGGTAGSIIFSESTTISSINNDTIYQKPMAVMVADSNGNPIAGAKVSLSIWPYAYHTGCWDPIPVTTDSVPDYYAVDIDGDGFVDPFTVGSGYLNEDQDRNLILGTSPDEDDNNDGQLTPSNSAAGTVPTSVTTDANGVGSFYLIYPKTSALWILDEFVASTYVLGTETRSTTYANLGWLEGDEPYLSTCSPYGY
jgi:hypothetical protein